MCIETLHLYLIILPAQQSWYYYDDSGLPLKQGVKKKRNFLRKDFEQIAAGLLLLPNCQVPPSALLLLCSCCLLWKQAGLSFCSEHLTELSLPRCSPRQFQGTPWTNNTTESGNVTCTLLYPLLAGRKIKLSEKKEWENEKLLPEVLDSMRNNNISPNLQTAAWASITPGESLPLSKNLD